MNEDLFGFRGGPTYPGAGKAELFQAALDQPMNLGSTIWDQTKGGVLESFGLGTALKDFATPQGNTKAGLTEPISDMALVPIPGVTGLLREGYQALTNKDQPSLSEDQYKASPYYRAEIPYDPGMTEQRAAALADWYDARKTREYFATKRPWTSFVANLAGQAADPVNYIEVAGPLVKAAAIFRAGRILGTGIAASLDAASNTALASLLTAGQRAKFGDDVSWEATVSQIATAALIGGAFGTIAGGLGARSDARLRDLNAGIDSAFLREFQASETDRLSTLKTTQEARVALNEAIGSVVRGEDVSLSPNATGPMERLQQEITAYHGSPHDFSAFSTEKIDTGEGAQAYGHGLYFAENAQVAEGYKNRLSRNIGDRRTGMGALDRAYEAGDEAGTLARLEGQLRSARKTIDKVGRDSPSAVDAVAQEQMYVDAIDLFKSGVRPGGSLYEVRIAADKTRLLDWDRPLSEQPPAVHDAVKKVLGDAYRDGMTGQEAYAAVSQKLGVPAPADSLVAQVEPGKLLPNDRAASAALEQAGIPGVQYLDAGSRDGTSGGTRNFVVFNDKRIRVAAKNGRPIDTSGPRPEPLPEGRNEAEATIGKPDNAKALAAQYQVDPETGSFPEESDIKQIETEGRLTEADKADLEAAQKTFDDGSAFGEALKAAVGCLV